MMNIEFTNLPITTDINFLTEKLYEEHPEFGTTTHFSFFIRDKSSRIIAGANGNIMFGSIYTDQLWVDKSYRKLGYGKKLMETVHAYGRKAGCRIATVSTMSFQHATVFYEKLGYAMEFKRSGYNQHVCCFFLKKAL